MEDKSQLEAITFDSGPALVLAGPGSGKTYVLTHHIKHLTDNGVKPENILVITFTRAAALEMKSRYDNLCKSKNRVVFGTFHSVFYRFLKIFNENTPKIISSKERFDLLEKIVRDNELADFYSNRISYFKSLIDKDKMNFSNASEQKEFFEVYKEYNEILNQNNVLDFDDILLECLKLCRENSSALSYIQNQFLHILIDEFQDINLVQYEIIKIISKNSIVFCVGDEDQSIYGFRGSNPGIMKRLLKDYPDLKVLFLKKNFRSFQDIIDFSNKVISKNQNRISNGKQECINKSNDKHVHLKVFLSKGLERSSFIEDFNIYEKKGKCAVLFRTNKDVFDFKESFFSGDKKRIKGEIEKEIFETIRDYVTFVLKKEIDCLKRIINKPKRNIPQSLIKNQNDLDVLVKENLGTFKGDNLFVFRNQLKVLACLNSYSFVMYLRNVCGLQSFFLEKYGEQFLNEISKAFEKVLDIAKMNVSFESFEKSLSIEKSILDNSEDKELNCFVSTFHQAKGLEFDYVFVLEAVEGKIPSGLSVGTLNIEEERRLFYVALTRAKKGLFVYTIKNEESGGMLPSRFLNDFFY